MGGIDKVKISAGREAIDEELESKLPFMFEQGGYIAHLDHLANAEISWDDFCYYRLILPDGSNVRFFDSDGSTPLSSEVEKLQREGQSYIWVKVPGIEGASDSDCIWMDYGGCFGS